MNIGVELVEKLFFYLNDNFDYLIIDKMKSITVERKNYTDNSICWGCNEQENNKRKFCSLANNMNQKHSICIDCYAKNTDNTLCKCLYCGYDFLLDYTQLSENDIIKYGLDEFLCCYVCLSKKQNVSYENYGRLDKLDSVLFRDDDLEEWVDEEERDPYVKYCNPYYEEDCGRIPEYNHFYDSVVRIVGKTKYVFNETEKNIKKKIANNLNNDYASFGIKGDVTSDDIHDLLFEQNFKCYKCYEKILTEGYEPYCCNQFSIDRINNSKPHDYDNVKISCYFCNCKDDSRYGKTIKQCDIENCRCSVLLELLNN